MKSFLERKMKLSIDYEPLNEVLSNYDITVLETKNESYKDKKGVWWVYTPKGNKILKKVSNSEDTLKYIVSAVKHLTENGILLPKINKTKTGDHYVKIDKTCFILLDIVEGKNPSYNSLKELKEIVRGLAKFHKASAGFFPPTESKPKIHLGTWIEDYSEQIEDMNNFYNAEVSSKENSEIGRTIIKEFPYFYKMGKKSIEGLKGSEYAEWVDKAAKTGCLCHQDFAAGNLFLNGSDLFIIDTDSITVDIPARDIRKLVNKIMKKNGKWDANLAKSIFEYYQQENPLTLSESEVIRLDLLFPHLFIGAMNKYYYKRDKEWTTEKYLKKIKEMAEIERSKVSILENFDSLVQG